MVLSSPWLGGAHGGVAISYADDITLLSSSLSAMLTLLGGALGLLFIVLGPFIQPNSFRALVVGQPPSREFLAIKGLLVEWVPQLWFLAMGIT